MDGLFVVSVADHKTGITGPAKHMFDEELLARARQYKCLIRPLLVVDGNNNPNFFVQPGPRAITKMSNLQR